MSTTRRAALSQGNILLADEKLFTVEKLIINKRAHPDSQFSWKYTFLHESMKVNKLCVGKTFWKLQYFHNINITLDLGNGLSIERSTFVD